VIDNALVINSGSSATKYHQLIQPSAGHAVASGLIEPIGGPAGAATHKYAGPPRQ
jgi:acetate kinase